MLGSISTKSIFKPLNIPQLEVATKELGVVQNKSPFLSDNDLQANRRAELALLVANTYLHLTKFFLLNCQKLAQHNLLFQELRISLSCLVVC